MTLVTNPILPGFHPDPCLCWAGEEYFVATSTFEWWPGVRIHRSRDLVKWEHAAYALTRKSQVDMRGNPASGGVWAPALSYADGRFWLIYSEVKGFNGCYKDVTNFLVTAERVEGPWSEPVRLNRSGFDPSLFHDEDGRKWLLNQRWDSRPGVHPFAGIVMQEYEAGAEHAVTVARSRSLFGPYEVSPHHPLLTSRGRPELRLQKAGHGSWVEGPDGRWYLAHLCGRPVGEGRRCILGRETALQALAWPAGEWPRLVGGGNAPAETVEVGGAGEGERGGDRKGGYRERFRDEFDGGELGAEWNMLREPAEEAWLSLGERPGWLRLRGRYGLACDFEQSVVGVRVTHHDCVARAWLEFNPESWQQTAGLAWYYSSSQYFYLEVGGDESGGRVLRLRVRDQGRDCSPKEGALELPATGGLGLEARMTGGGVALWVEGGGRGVAGVWAGVRRDLDLGRAGDRRGAVGVYGGLCGVVCAGQRAGGGDGGF